MVEDAEVTRGQMRDPGRGAVDESDRIRVLVVDLSSRFGGADVRVLQLVSRLNSNFEICVAVLAGSETESRFVDAGIPVAKVATSRRNPMTVFRLQRMIRRFNPSIVDTHNIQSQIWGLVAAVWLNVPVRVATLHSIYEQSEWLGNRLGIYRGLTRLIGRLATKVVSVSEPVDVHAAENSIPAWKRTVINNGIERGPRPANWRRPFSRNDAPLKILCVGRLVAVKGQRFLLEALAGIGAGNRGWECDLVGDGPRATALKELAVELKVADRVHFLGYRQDVANMLSACDLVCMPSLAEGLPYSILEAALAERPVIASAVGGIARHFRHGETICLVEPANVDQLRSAIEWAMNSPDEAIDLGRRARRCVETDFTATQMAERTEALYMSALATAKCNIVSA